MAKQKKKSEIDLAEENLHYFDNRHWQYWIGPRWPENDPKYEEVMGQIERVFQSSNRIAECIDRYRTALIGKRPHWYLVDAAGERSEDDRASAAEQLLQRWIDRQYELAVTQESQLSNPFTDSVKNMLVTERGYLRLWAPERFRNSQNPINRVCLHSPPPGSVTINRDKDGFIDSIEYVYTEDEKQRKEVQTIDPVTEQTIFTTLDEKGEQIPDETFALDLGGRYSIYEMRSPSLVTTDVKQAQNAINFALTMMPRNTEVGGFRERLILGAQQPGRWQDDQFIPATEFQVGPGRTNFIQGTPLFDDVGKLKGYTNPSVFNSEPVQVESFIDTAMTFVAVIYHRMKQSHLLGSDLQLSGVSREQSRQDFETALLEQSEIVTPAFAGIYSCALMMMVQPVIEEYKDLSAVVQLRLNASTPTTQELEQILKYQQAGLLSRTTTVTLSGFTDDPDAEQALLEDEERSRNAVDDATNLVVAGVIDQSAAVSMLKTSGRLKDAAGVSNKDEVLNGSGVKN